MGTYWEDLDRVIEDGMRVAARDYGDRSAAVQLAGWLAGLEACRRRDPLELKALLERARSQLLVFSGVDEFDGYKYLRETAAAIQWVYDVLSHAPNGTGAPSIIQPSAQGAVRTGQLLARSSLNRPVDPVL